MKRNRIKEQTTIHTTMNKSDDNSSHNTLGPDKLIKYLPVSERIFPSQVGLFLL